MSFDPDPRTDGNRAYLDVRQGAMTQIQDVLLAREALHNSGYFITKVQNEWTAHFPNGASGTFGSLDETKDFMREEGVDLTKVLVKDPDSQSGWYAAAYNR